MLILKFLNQLIFGISIYISTSMILANAAGYVENISVTGNSFNIRGWACDSTRPDDIAGIHIYQNNLWLTGGNAPIYREWAVAAACSSTHSNHGFNITFELPSNLLDGNSHKIKTYAVGSGGFVELLTNLVDNNVVFGNAPLAPQGVGDIVARDLDLTGVGALGHIGFWDGSQVIEVLNESTVVQTNTWSNFRSRADKKTWDTLRPNLPNSVVSTCFEDSCVRDTLLGEFGGVDPSYYKYTSAAVKYAMARRALQIKRIGATYTVTSYPTYARPMVRDGIWTHLPVRGNYRCDTFILDLYAVTDIPDGASPNFVWGSNSNFLYKKRVYNNTPTWQNRINLLFTSTAVLPKIIYDRLKTFN